MSKEYGDWEVEYVSPLFGSDYYYRATREVYSTFFGFERIDHQRINLGSRLPLGAERTAAALNGDLKGLRIALWETYREFPFLPEEPLFSTESLKAELKRRGEKKM